MVKGKHLRMHVAVVPVGIIPLNNTSKAVSFLIIYSLYVCNNNINDLILGDMALTHLVFFNRLSVVWVVGWGVGCVMCNGNVTLCTHTYTYICLCA